MNAQERIREARKLERKMGLTVMEQGKDLLLEKMFSFPSFRLACPPESPLRGFEHNDPHCDCRIWSCKVQAGHD